MIKNTIAVMLTPHSVGQLSTEELLSGSGTLTDAHIKDALDKIDDVVQILKQKYPSLKYIFNIYFVTEDSSGQAINRDIISMPMHETPGGFYSLRGQDRLRSMRYCELSDEDMFQFKNDCVNGIVVIPHNNLLYSAEALDDYQGRISQSNTLPNKCYFEFLNQGSLIDDSSSNRKYKSVPR